MFYLINCITLILLPLAYMVSSKLKKIEAVNSLTSMQHSYKCMVYYSSFKLVVKSLYIRWLQYMNNSVRKIDKNNYEITYVINGKIYKMVVCQKRGPPPFVIETDENVDNVDNVDNVVINNTILSYYGPNQDWHGNKHISPTFFGTSRLKFIMRDGSEFVFRDNEVINF